MKISVIMQSYLGDYPGSRSRPKEKFIRAVSSFLSQLHEDKELIIVSDGCNITKELYDSFYKNNPLIRFIYLDKKEDQQTNNIKKENKNTIYNFRGFPRGVGCYVATGEIICYFDTDDIILPHHLSVLNAAWNNAPENLKWINNPIRYVHPKALNWSKNLEEREKQMQQKVKNKESINLLTYGIKDVFFKEEFDKGMIRCSSSSVSHKKNIKTTWADSVMILDEKQQKIEGFNEDHLFVQNIIKNENCKGLRIDEATLVVCHYNNLYDL